MAPPKYPENPFAEKRDHEIGALFEKARAHKNFKEARKGAQEAVNVAILGEDDEEQKVDILFKDHYKPAEYITGKPKPAIEYGKTHLLLGNVDSDAFDSNLERGPQYYEDLQKNATLFIELKDYIDINFPALKDPTKKTRMLEMIEKTKEFAGPFDLKSFKAFCTQNKFKKAEVFGKSGLSQVLLAFSRAIEPVDNRDLLSTQNFKITDTNPNPLFYRIELGIGKAGSNDKDRYSIVLKSGLNDEGKGTYDPGDIDKLDAPPADDDEEEPYEPTPPAEPAQPVAPLAPGEPAQPAAPTAPVNPDTPPPAPPETPPEETRKLDITYPGNKVVTYTLVGVPKEMVPGQPVPVGDKIFVTFTQQLVPVAAPTTPDAPPASPPPKAKIFQLAFATPEAPPKKVPMVDPKFEDFFNTYTLQIIPPADPRAKDKTLTLKFEKRDAPVAPAQPTKPDAPTAPADPAAPAKDPAAPPATPPTPDKPADTPTPAPIAGLNTVQHDIKIDDVDTKLETNAPDGFTYEITQTDEPKGYAIKVYFTDPKHPDDPAKTGIINFGKNPDYTADDPINGHQFSYNFKNTPGTASSLDIWKFCELKTDPTKPSITITKLPSGKIAAPSISYFPENKQIMVCPTADIGKRKLYTIDDQSGQNLKFEYFNEDGTQSLHVTTQDGGLAGDLDIAAGTSKPLIRVFDAAYYSTDIFQHYDFAFTEGPGATPGTLKITKKPEDIKETTHELEIAMNQVSPDEKTKFTLTIKAPGAQLRSISTKEGKTQVQFNGLTGYFEIMKDQRDGTYEFTYANNSADGDRQPSKEDLWNYYKPICDLDKKTITIEKLEKKPLPRLEYDEKTAMVIFYEEVDGGEVSTPYKINMPDYVKVQYYHHNYDAKETWNLNFFGGEETQDYNGYISIKPDKTIETAYTPYNLWTTHNISFNDTADPKTLDITKISDTVHPDVPRILFDAAKYNEATGQGSFTGHFTDGTKKEYQLALPPNTRISYSFSEGSNSLILHNKDVFTEKGTDPGQIQLDFEINLNGAEAKPVVTTSIIKETHVYNFNSDTNTITIAEKGKVVVPPSTPHPAPPAPAPATGIGTKLGAPPTPAVGPTAPGSAPTVAAEAPEAGKAFQIGVLTFKFDGTIQDQKDGKTVKYKKDGKTFTIELSSDGTGKITDKDAQFTHTLNITSTGNEHTVEIRPAVVDQVEVSPSKDKITVTLNNGNSKAFNLVLPEDKKDDIAVSSQSWRDGGPFVQLKYQNSTGYIKFNSLLKSLKNYTPKTGNIKNSADFFGDSNSQAPFTFSFEKGDKDAPSTLTITSNEEAKEIVEKVTELEKALAPLNEKFSTKFKIDAANCDASIVDLDADEYIGYLTAAIETLSPLEKEAIKQVGIYLDTKTEKQGGPPTASLDYKINTSGGLILAELRKIIGFFFIKWTPDVEKAATDGVNFKCEDDLGNSKIWYQSATFDPKNKGAYTPAEGDYKIEYDSDNKIEKMFKFQDESWRPVIGRPQKSREKPIDARKLAEETKDESEGFWQRWYSDAYDGL